MRLPRLYVLDSGASGRGPCARLPLCGYFPSSLEEGVIGQVPALYADVRLTCLLLGPTVEIKSAQREQMRADCQRNLMNRD